MRQSCRGFCLATGFAATMLATSSPASADTARYFYDALGRLTGATTEAGQVIGYTYDGADNRTRVEARLALSPPDHGINGEQVLLQGQARNSADGRFVLVFQEDGNLVLYRTGTGQALWATNTNGRQGSSLFMQSDGNLVLYDPQFRGLWSSGTNGVPGAGLSIQSDGNLVIYDNRNGQAVWASNTSQP